MAISPISCASNVSARRLGSKSRQNELKGLPFGAKADSHNAAMEAYNRYSGAIGMTEEVFGGFTDVDVTYFFSTGLDVTTPVTHVNFFARYDSAAHVSDRVMRVVEEGI